MIKIIKKWLCNQDISFGFLLGSTFSGGVYMIIELIKANL